MEQKHYELTFIISTGVPETEHPEIKKKVDEILAKFEANITDTQDLGKKKFTYAIEKIRHGFYQVIEFNAMPDTIIKISEEFKLLPQVLRFLIVTKKEITAEEKAKELARRNAKEEKKEEAVKTEKETTEEKSKESKKVSLEDLDEKLDEIFENDTIVK
ncbi:30S ribosomal protein S6 [Patescibacteria group bacterium]|nr:30S ribosomal protein S6 [Patescibacteria group bacterium]